MRFECPPDCPGEHRTGRKGKGRISCEQEAKRRAAISRANTGKSRSAETRAKLSEAAKRQWASPERRAQMREWWSSLTPEERAERAARMRAGITSESRARTGDRLRGRPRSSEARAAISEGMKRAYRERRRQPTNQFIAAP